MDFDFDALEVASPRQAPPPPPSRPVTGLRSSGLRACDHCGMRSNDGAAGFDGFGSEWYCGACWALWDTEQVEQAEPELEREVRVLAGFGEPWRVLCPQLDVRRSPSAGASPVGFLRKGDVVGVRRLVDGWAELSEDSDMRLFGSTRLGLAAAKDAEWDIDVNYVMARVVGTTVRAKVKRKDPQCQAWVRLADPSVGSLLERTSVRERLSLGACVVSERRSRMYTQVLELCRQRVYVENLEALWEGDRARLPTAEALEEKLLHEDALVVHISRAGAFLGGAVLRVVHVRAEAAGGPRGDGDESVTVCYVDVCAALDGTHAGSVLWDAIKSMDFACVACHSVLLQRTVDFWEHRGMRRYEASSERDCVSFARQLRDTTGKVCSLSDVSEALPSSSLPLLLFVSSAFVKPRIPPCVLGRSLDD